MGVGVESSLPFASRGAPESRAMVPSARTSNQASLFPFSMPPTASESPLTITCRGSIGSSSARQVAPAS